MEVPAWTVTQGSQTRSFLYDTGSMLTSAANPESGTTSYTYDPAGNLKTRLDSRGITTIYSYDALNRPTLTTYSDATPTVGYTYDNNPAVPYSIGRLTQVTNGWSTTNITGYDPFGQVTGSQQVIAGQTYSFHYIITWPDR